MANTVRDLFDRLRNLSAYSPDLAVVCEPKLARRLAAHQISDDRDCRLAVRGVSVFDEVAGGAHVLFDDPDGAALRALRLGAIAGEKRLAALCRGGDCVQYHISRRRGLKKFSDYFDLRRSRSPR